MTNSFSNIHEDNWEVIFNAFSNPVFILDRNYTILFANTASKNLDIEVSEKLTDKNCFEVLHKSTCPPQGCPYAQCLESKDTCRNNMYIEAFGKTYNIKCTPLKNENGEIDKILHIAEDVTDKDLSQTQLYESEIKYRQLFNNHISGFALHEIICNENNKPIDYRYLEINPAFERMTGLIAKDTIGKTINSIMPRTESYWINTYGQVALEGKPIVLENYSIELDKYFEVYAYSPKRGQFATIFNDITQRKKTNQALINSENRLNAIIDQAPDAIYLHDFDGRIITANDKAEELTGYSVEELVTMNITQIDSSFISQVEDKIWNKLTENNTITIESVNKHKLGHDVPVEVRIGIVNVDHKKKIIAFAHDISKRIKANQEIAIHNERLESLHRISQYNFENQTDFLDFVLEEALNLTSSKIGYIYLYNEETETFTLNSWSKGVLDECMVMERQTQYELSQTGLWGEAVRQRKPIIENNYKKANNPHKKGTPNGHVEMKNFLTVPFFVKNKIEAVIGVANKDTDYIESDIKQLQILMDGTWNVLEKNNLITELIIAKEKAEESNAIKTAFLANISHEIRTPMNAILGFTELLKSDMLGSEDRAHYASIIKQSGEQLLKVINDIIDIAKISANALVPKKQICNIHKIINDSIEIIKQQQYLKLKSHIKISTNWKEEYSQLNVYSDQVRIQQIFTNLISNAIKYTNEGTINIGSLEPQEGFITFYVKDTGIGIPQEQIVKIFELFRQLQENSNIEGTGIGLNITQGLVKLLGGEIWVESEVNVGSTFYFTLPYEKSEITDQEVYVPEQKNISYNWNNKVIYIAEDEQASFQFLQIILKETGIQIHHAKNGEELIELVQKKVPDLLLLDINMPKMNGKEVMLWLQAENINVPTIAQTAYSLPEDIAFLKELGFNSHVPKPINKEFLFSEIKKQLFKS